MLNKHISHPVEVLIFALNSKAWNCVTWTIRHIEEKLYERIPDEDMIKYIDIGVDKDDHMSSIKLLSEIKNDNSLRDMLHLLCIGSKRIMEAAASVGRLHVIIWLYELLACNRKRCCKMDSVFIKASKGGHLDIMKWIIVKMDGETKADMFSMFSMWSNNICTGLINSGITDEKVIESLLWLEGIGCNIKHVETFEAMALRGNLEHMVWLKYEKECPWSERTFENAILHGNLENMKWLILHGCPRGEDLIGLAFRSKVQDSKVLENVKWLMSVMSGEDNSIQWGSIKEANYAFCKCALRGSLGLVKWMCNPLSKDNVEVDTDKGCPWSEIVLSNAVYAGNMDVIIWLLKVGCPYDEYEIISSCVGTFNTKVMDWILDNLIPMSSKWVGICLGAGRMDCLLYLSKKYDIKGLVGEWTEDGERSKVELFNIMQSISGVNMTTLRDFAATNNLDDAVCMNNLDKIFAVSLGGAINDMKYNEITKLFEELGWDKNLYNINKLIYDSI
ncbi:Ankyrin-repeat protein [Orpheovirus IHUMI-LCC2]|uniref:Ankyrin-repeat protein n=1 Tax=Orpheovirus IHUMI-LCC2 TaxID=2023057 RepID=A0A2I2L3L7_9VIRU|nr:Ankyrin-repeat protein [Orpheovirus IHUMI-LCC2]SNW62145.1 Ankyrin-repeat protein [Orpheovirus IHUMI-LCC2]